MFPEAIEGDKFAKLQPACAMGCLALGLGDNEVERHRLADVMVKLAEDGQSDPEIIRAMAVHRMQPPAAGLFHAI